MRMSNAIAKWLRSFRLRGALRQGNTGLAQQLLEEIKISGAKLSWLEKLFQNWLAENRAARDYREEIAALKRQVEQLLQQKEQLEREKVFDAFEPEATPEILVPNREFIDFVTDSFQLRDLDEGKIQATGICKDIFGPFEADLADFVEESLNKFPCERRDSSVKEAREDLRKLRDGIDPQYSFELSSEVYLIKHFLEHVYCTYIAWFLIYKAGLLPVKLNILDIGSGPLTTAYGLALLLQSSSGFFSLPQMHHISYYSLERQDRLQEQGLQFWCRYIEPRSDATNAYFRLDTANILAYDPQAKSLPEGFFDFIVISHCIFSDRKQRAKSHEVYRQIFANNLAKNGYALVIVQLNKLFKGYGIPPSEDLEREKSLIKKLLDELGLTLEWYKYFASTGRRVFMKNDEFRDFAEDNLPKPKEMGRLHRKYINKNYERHYAADDYVILAKRKL
ncbi:MAG: photosystem II assembly protein [Oscillatoria sp. SIO1A7]|nr:photosystem II assembly protein [Oscillatoria sp. SIO1A7]